METVDIDPEFVLSFFVFIIIGLKQSLMNNFQHLELLLRTIISTVIPQNNKMKFLKKTSIDIYKKDKLKL